MSIANAIAPSIGGSIAPSIGGGVVVVPPVASPIARVAQAATTTSFVGITLPGGANTLIEVFISSGLATPGDYTFTIGGLSIPYHDRVDHASGEPELQHHYLNSAAFQALTGVQTVTVGGDALASNPDILIRVLSNVDDASPIASVAKYDVDEDSTIVSLTASATANNFVSMYVVHDLGRTWDTFSGVSNAHVGARAAAGEHAVTTTGSFTGSISHSAGNSNVRKAGMLVQYRAA